MSEYVRSIPFIQLSPGGMEKMLEAARSQGHQYPGQEISAMGQVVHIRPPELSSNDFGRYGELLDHEVCRGTDRRDAVRALWVAPNEIAQSGLVIVTRNSQLGGRCKPDNKRPIDIIKQDAVWRVNGKIKREGWELGEPIPLDFDNYW